MQDVCLNVYLAVEKFLALSSNGSILSQYVTSLSILLELIPMSVILLLSVLLWFVSLLFDYLNRQMLKPMKMANEDRLEQWRRQHALLCELIVRINRCFGVVLLLAIANTFVSFVTLTFEMAMAFQQDAGRGFHLCLIKLLRQLVRLVMITFNVHRMETEVDIEDEKISLQSCRGH